MASTAATRLPISPSRDRRDSPVCNWQPAASTDEQFAEVRRSLVARGLTLVALNGGGNHLDPAAQQRFVRMIELAGRLGVSFIGGSSGAIAGRPLDEQVQGDSQGLRIAVFPSCEKYKVRILWEPYINPANIATSPVAFAALLRAFNDSPYVGIQMDPSPSRVAEDRPRRSHSRIRPIHFQGSILKTPKSCGLAAECASSGRCRCSSRFLRLPVPHRLLLPVGQRPPAPFERPKPVMAQPDGARDQRRSPTPGHDVIQLITLQPPVQTKPVSSKDERANHRLDIGIHARCGVAASQPIDAALAERPVNEEYSIGGARMRELGGGDQILRWRAPPIEYSSISLAIR